MTNEQPRCARIAAELGEQLAGTAPETTGWVALEHPGPWSPSAPTEAEVGALATRLRADGVRLQLIRPVRRPHQPGPSLSATSTVLLAHAAVEPARRWMRRLVLDDPGDLATLSLDPRVTLEPTPPAIGTPVEHDVWLVCTHARRDACCALHGRPVALALEDAGVEVWETTHTGGHRFAATGVLLPDGLSLGRLDTVEPAALARSMTAGALPTELLRGRGASPRPAQAAEVALRAHLALTGRDAVLAVATEPGPDHVAVTLHVGAQRWRATVRTAAAAQPRPVSDAAPPTHPEEHRVLELERL